MHIFGHRLGQPVGQRLQQNVGIIVMLCLEPGELRFDAKASGHGKSAKPIGIR